MFSSAVFVASPPSRAECKQQTHQDYFPPYFGEETWMFLFRSSLSMTARHSEARKLNAVGPTSLASGKTVMKS